MQIRLLLLVVTFFCGTAAAASAGIAYVIPFKIETEAPITRADIVTSVRERCRLTSAGALENILSSSTRTSKLFDERSVRAKVIEGRKSVFIDSAGVLNLPQGFAIAEPDLRRIVFDHSDKQKKCTLGRPRF